MRPGASGTATIRHVGLVALEALLIAMLVWLGAMTLAGATGSGGLGSADAGKVSTDLHVADGNVGDTTDVTTTSGDDGTWIHATCLQGGVLALDEWARVDATGHATLSLGPTAAWTSGGAACTAEEGYFAHNGRWRVVATTTFSVAP